MAWNNLKLSLVNTIFPNTTKQIDAQTHQEFEDELIDALGALQYKGVVIPTTNLGYIDGTAWVLAKTAGTYANFSGQTLATGEIAFLKFNGSAWTKDVVINTTTIGAVSSVLDTTTIDLTLASGVLSGSVKLNPATNNDLTATGTGLFLNVQNSGVDDNNNLLGLGAGTESPLVDLLDEITLQLQNIPSLWIADANGIRTLGTVRVGIGVASSANAELALPATTATFPKLSMSKGSGMGFGVVPGALTSHSTDAFAWYTGSTETTLGTQIGLLASTGQLRFNNYGAGTFSGTTTRYPAFTSAGFVVEKTVAQMQSELGISTAAGVWTKTGTVLHPTTLTDSVGIGTSTPFGKLSNATTNFDDNYTNLNGGNSLNWQVDGEYYAAGVRNNSTTTGGGFGLLLMAGNGTNSNTRILNVATLDKISRLIVKGDGNVGINTNAPTERLDINGNLRVRGLTSNNFVKSSSTGVIQAGVIADLVTELNTVASMWTANGTTAYRPSGNVGIGVSTPHGKLSNSSDLLDDNYSASNGANTFNWQVNGGFYAATIKNSFTDVVGGFGLLVSAGTTASPNGRIFNVTTVDKASRFIVRASGNVGIGTPNPTAKLEVFGGSIYCFDNSLNARVLFGQNVSAGNYGGLTFNNTTKVVSLTSNSSTLGDVGLNVENTGRIQFNRYTSAINFTGTPSTFAAFDASGFIVQRTAAQLLSDIGAPTYTFTSGLTPTGNTIRLGGTLTQSTVITGSGNSLEVNMSSGGTSLATIWSTTGITQDFTAVSGQKTSKAETTSTMFWEALLPSVHKSSVLVANGSLQFFTDNLTNGNQTSMNLFSTGVQFDTTNGTDTAGITTTPTEVSNNAITGRIKTNGTANARTSSKTANYTIVPGDYLVIATVTGLTFNLPASGSRVNGDTYILGVTTGTLTVDAAGTELIGTTQTQTVSAGSFITVMWSSAYGGWLLN